MKTCAFTGHRPKGLGYPESDGRCDALKRLLRLLVRRLIQEQGVTFYLRHGPGCGSVRRGDCAGA